MTYRDELNRPANIPTYSEDGKLRSMENAARAGTKGNSRLMGTKWLSVFVKDGELIYDWQGGYPTNRITREVAIQVLARA